MHIKLNDQAFKLTPITDEEALASGLSNQINFGGKLLTVDLQPTPVGELSDGYHTFNELYDHRITLFLALCKELMVLKKAKHSVWKSHLHHDGSRFDGWFIMGIEMSDGRQISYHLPNDRWDEASFAQTLNNAPVWDGHTAADVLQRLKEL